MTKKFLPAYKEALLVKSQNGWYIDVQYLTKKNQNKYKRTRPRFGLNRILDLRKREFRGLDIVDRINWWMTQGYWFEDFSEIECIHKMRKSERVEQIQQETINIIQAIEQYRDAKMAELADRPGSVRTYKSHCNQFVTFLRLKGMENMQLGEFTPRHAVKYRDYWVNDCKIKNNNTYNNKLTHIKIIFNGLVKDDYIQENPFDKLKKRRKQKANKDIWTKEEAKNVSSEMRDYDPWLWAAAQLAFWGNVRQSELCRLKAEFFRIDPFVIKWPEDTTKNREAYTTTLPRFLFHQFKEIGFWDIPSYYYCFGKGMKAGREQSREQMLNRRHQPFLRRQAIKGTWEKRKGISFSTWRRTGGNLMAHHLNNKELKDFWHHNSFDTTERYMHRENLIKPLLEMNWEKL